MTKCPAEIKIGTRASKLAVAQSVEVKNRLLGAFPDLTQDQIHIIKIQTTGDKIQDRHLADIGGKGLFTKEIEESLASGAIDMAVHSMKDMPDTLPDGMVIDCILEREDARDAFISNKFDSINDLPQGAVVGTSSVRRQSQLLNIRPDLKIVPIRGNIFTRLKKLERGDVDATFLAVAGLKRVDMQHVITEYISTDIMLPAVAQGAIGVECMAKNEHILKVLEHINHQRSNIRVQAERGFLTALNGSCSTPIAALAEYDSEDDICDIINLRGFVADIDGSGIKNITSSGNVKNAWDIGYQAGQNI